MKVIHYIPSIDASTGGTAVYMHVLVKELGKLVDLHVVTHHSPNPVKIGNADLHYVTASLLGGMRREFTALLTRIRPDIVHVNGCWMPQCALAQRLAMRLGCKVVLTPHGMLEPWIIRRHYYSRKLPALWLYQKRAVATADCLHATAESEMVNLAALGYSTDIEVITNGIDVDDIAVKTSWQCKYKILFLSRVHVKKGIELLIDAVRILSDKLKMYEVTVAGEGDGRYIESLKKQVEESGLSSTIRFVGGVYGEEKWKMLRDADVLVLPTASENFGIVVAEALACGTPVITTKGAPWRDLVEWNCGWWVERSVGSLVDALQAFLMLTDDERERMGRNGRRLVETKYSSRRMADEMFRLYGRLTGR